MNKIHVVILSIIIGALFFLFQNKEINPVPVVNAQTCPVPAQVTNVAVTFPSCVGDVCNFTQGSCTWSTVIDATNYKVIVTDIETGVIVTNQQINSATTSATFPVTQTNTYKCDISAINSCGAIGAVGTASLLCKVDAAVTTTPTPTPIPTLTPTLTPVPVMPVTGSNVPLMLFSIVGIVLIISGITLFRF